jgi:hypothetical protein
MKTVWQSKLAKRCLLLLALAGALVYLNTPAVAGSCQQECYSEEQTCIQDCNQIGWCIRGCLKNYYYCLQDCT